MKVTSITSSDRVRVALYRLELAILPHVESDAERARRCKRMGELRSTLPADVQDELIRDFIRHGGRADRGR